LAQYLVHGVDVWLNNPLPPLEACGTSGMKASLNGVPHLSIMDGWWIEAFNGHNGWSIGGEEETADRDAKDAATIYAILEQEVVPLYYQVNDEGTPAGWVKMMKAAIKSTGPLFSARRMVKEYSQKFYQPAIQAAAK
jgi:glycogen phosphorylase